MGISIKTNMSAVRTLNITNQNNTALQKSMLRLSSGLRINSGADDAAGLIISEKMRARIRADEQANRNIQTGTAMLNVAEGGVTTITDILITMNDKVLQGANAIGATDETNAIAKELKSLSEEITEIATTTKYNGRTLISNMSRPLSLQIGPEAGGSLTVLSKNINLTASALGLGSSIIGSNLFTSIGSTTDAGNVNNVLSAISTALASVLEVQGEIAKVQSRLGYQSDNLVNESTNLKEGQSAIRDTDMTSEMANFAKWNVLSQISQLMLAQAGQNAYSVVGLLQQ